MDKFWTEDPSILFRHSKLLELWPYKSMTYEQQLNATTRFVILVSLLGYMFLNNYVVLLLGAVLVSLIFVVHKFKKRESVVEGMEVSSCTEQELYPTKNNPFQNVLMTDYVDNPEKTKVVAKYDEDVEGKINDKVKEIIVNNNKDNKDIGNIFKNLSDTMEFEQSLRQFHINPSTTIPNDQGDFLKYCYNDLYSEKQVTLY